MARAFPLLEGKRHILRRWHEPAFGPRLQIDRLQPQNPRDLAITGIAGLRQGKPVAGIEERQKRQNKSRRGARRDNDPAGGNVDFMRLAVMARDAFAKLGQAKRIGIAHRAPAHLAFDRFAHEAGSGCPWLTDLHVNDVAARSLAGVRLSHDIHDNKSVDRASQGWRKRSRGCLWRALRHEVSYRPAMLFRWGICVNLWDRPPCNCHPYARFTKPCLHERHGLQRCKSR